MRLGGFSPGPKDKLAKLMKTLYVETSVVSYLTARPSANLLVAASQKITVDWWATRKREFELYVSDVVLEEAGRGDSVAASQRMEVLANIPSLEITDGAVALSREFVRRGALPSKALDDALHVAIAAVSQMDFLLTWNCRHIDNAEIKPVIRNICRENGHPCPEICTPQELMGVS